MNSTSLRINELINEKKFSVSAFEKEIGVGNGAISTLIKRNSNPSGDILLKILTTFKEIDANWLITGNGEKYKSEILQYNNEIESSVNETLDHYKENLQLYKDMVAMLKEENERLKKMNSLDTIIEALQFDVNDLKQFKEMLMLEMKLKLNIGKEKTEKPLVNTKGNSSE